MTLQVCGTVFERCPATVLQDLLNNVADDPWNEGKLQVCVLIRGHIMCFYTHVGHWHLVVATNVPDLFCGLLANLCHITFWIHRSGINPCPYMWHKLQSW